MIPFTHPDTHLRAYRPVLKDSPATRAPRDPRVLVGALALLLLVCVGLGVWR